MTTVDFVAGLALGIVLGVAVTLIALHLTGAL